MVSRLKTQKYYLDLERKESYLPFFSAKAIAASLVLKVKTMLERGSALEEKNVHDLIVSLGCKTIKVLNAVFRK